MATLQELIAQKEALDRQIEEATSDGRNKALEQIKALMAENGLSLADISDRSSPGNKSAKPKTNSGTKVSAKYRNPTTGETWSGRGLQPRWLKAALAGGQKIEDLGV